MANSQKKLKGRATRVRSALKSVSKGRARLSVFRSGKHIYAQVIDDVKGETVAAASSIEQTSRKDVPKGSGMPAAAYVGKLIAERSLKKGVAEVMFDRGPYIFHGRVKALADAAREAGLNF